MGENEVGKFRYENLGFIFQEFNLLDSLTVLFSRLNNSNNSWEFFESKFPVGSSATTNLGFVIKALGIAICRLKNKNYLSIKKH